MVCFPVAVYDIVGGDLLDRDEAMKWSRRRVLQLPCLLEEIQ